MFMSLLGLFSCQDYHIMSFEYVGQLLPGVCHSGLMSFFRAKCLFFESERVTRADRSGCSL